MRRYNSFIIRLKDNWNFKEFRDCLTELNAEFVDYKNHRGRWIIFIPKPSNELFKFKDNFEWLKGTANLWIEDTEFNKVLLTRENYREVDFEDITSEPPEPETDDVLFSESENSNL